MADLMVYGKEDEYGRQTVFLRCLCQEWREAEPGLSDFEEESGRDF
jgi:hypothetical protein